MPIIVVQHTTRFSSHGGFYEARVLQNGRELSSDVTIGAVLTNSLSTHTIASHTQSSATSGQGIVIISETYVLIPRTPR